MKVHLTTLGCPKKQVDSELMLGMLVQHGDELDGLTLGALWSDNSVTRGKA
jgi:tRNA A37 methylthiotransferase MiaB